MEEAEKPCFAAISDTKIRGALLVSLHCRVRVNCEDIDAIKNLLFFRSGVVAASPVFKQWLREYSMT